MKPIADHPTDLTPSPPRSRRRWIHAAIALVLLAVGVQLGLAYRHYNENAAYVKLLDRAKYGGGMRTTHSTGRVHDAFAVVADTQFGPLPAIGDRLQETWWLLGEPKQIQIAGPGVPLETVLAHVAGSRDVEIVGLFSCGTVGDELRHIAECEKLTTLFLRDNTLSPNALQHVAACTHLTQLDLRKSKGVDDHSLKALRSLTRLTRLELASTAISDAGLAELKDLRPALLDLENTTLSDASIPVLVQMAPKHLRLSGTHLTAEGFARLQRSLPDANIAWSESD